jgi:hypothetical protein
MGVAVAGAVLPVCGAVGFELANAGMAVGPSAVVNASNNAIVFLGASDFSVAIITFLLYPAQPICETADTLSRSISQGSGSGWRITITAECFTAVGRKLKEDEIWSVTLQCGSIFHRFLEANDFEDARLV